MVDKKGVSLMVSYVILISVGIGLSIAVYAWLSDYPNIFQPKIDCKEGTSLFLDDYDCSEEGIINLTVKNNGYFNISGFIISASNESGKMPITLLNATGAGTQGFLLGHYYFNPALKPGGIGRAVFIRNNIIKKVQIQPFTTDEKGRKIMCEQAVIRQNINCIGGEVLPFDMLSLPGFVSWWRFNESSGNISSDFIGTNNGTLNNMDDSGWVTGKSGNALEFDGVDDYVDALSIDSINTDIKTVGVWFKTSFSDDNQQIVGIGAGLGLGTDRLTSFMNKTGNIRISQNFDTVSGHWWTHLSYNDGDWHHLAYVYDRSSSANDPLVYIDRVLVSLYEETPSGSATTGDDRVRIGVTGAGGSFFNGTIDEVMIFNTALSQQNILDICDYYN